MKKLFVLVTIFFVIFILGCEIEPQSTDTKVNCKVAFLFEQDGVKVYRFTDMGYSRYFTTRGDTFWQERVGKTTRPVEVTSVPVEQTNNESQE